MRKIVVISTPTQYRKFLEVRPDAEEFLVFCDNERCYGFLSEKKIPYKALEEGLLKERWNEINAWGCTKAAGWIRECQKDGLFPKYGLPSMIYLYFSLILILVLKNYLYARHLLEKYLPAEVFLFESSEIGNYPAFSGNAFLNIFLKETALAQNIRVTAAPLSEGIDTPHPDSPTVWRRAALRWARGIVERIYAVFVKAPQGRQAVLAYGSLKHLGPVVAELKKNRREVLLYDDSFHLEQCLFAFRQGIFYLIPGSFPDGGQEDADIFSKDLMSDLRTALQKAKERRYFSFGSYDLAGFLESRVFARMKKYMERWACEEKHYQVLRRSVDLTGVLIEEDFAGRAFFAAFMKAHGVPVYCVSHANLIVDFQVPDEDKVFAQSFTFVNSEYEKTGYVMRGWQPDKVLVSGLPRYDRLKSLILKNEAQTRPRVLYCAGVLWGHSPDALGYLGCRNYALKNTQLLTIHAVFHAIKSLSLELVIKPHYFEDEPQWRRLVERYADPKQVRLVNSSDDFLQCVADSDAMLVSYWSTALVEAGMLGVPVIYVDLESQDSAAVRQYSTQGFCEVVKNLEELRQALQKIGGPARRTASSSAPLEYYFGKKNGSGAARIAEGICQRLAML